MSIDPGTKEFLTVEEAAKVLGVAGSTVTKSIDEGNLRAVVLTSAHRATRIHRSELFRHEQQDNSTDLRLRRLRRLQVAARDAREAAERKRQDWLAAQDGADAAARAVDDELALYELDEITRRKSA